MVSKNVKMISMKSKEGDLMPVSVREDIRSTTMKLTEVYRVSPESYFFLKGFIHCLLQKIGTSNSNTKAVES